MLQRIINWFASAFQSLFDFLSELAQTVFGWLVGLLDCFVAYLVDFAVTVSEGFDFPVATVEATEFFAQSVFLIETYIPFVEVVAIAGGYWALVLTAWVVRTIIKLIPTIG